MDDVRAIVDRAARFPESGSRVPGLPADRDVRRFVSLRFPYAVLTALIGEPRRRAVVAVAHTRREPGFWRDRLK